MRTSLLATAAAVAIITGPALAQKQEAPASKVESPAPAPKAMQNAPAEKSAPAGSVQKAPEQKAPAGSAQKAPESKAPAGSAQKAPDTKAPASTTGQSTPGSRAEEKSPAASDKPGATPRSSTTMQPGAAPSGSNAQTRTGAQSGTTAQGSAGAQGGASVSLTNEQKTKIRTSVLQGSSVPRATNVNFSINVGTVVPTTVRFAPLPPILVEIHPAWRGYQYFVVNDEIIIVEPGSHRIVAVLAV